MIVVSVSNGSVSDNIISSSGVVWCYQQHQWRFPAVVIVVVVVVVAYR